MSVPAERMEEQGGEPRRPEAARQPPLRSPYPRGMGPLAWVGALALAAGLHVAVFVGFPEPEAGTQEAGSGGLEVGLGPRARADTTPDESEEEPEEQAESEPESQSEP
ncbi:MAG: hypothetical protein ACLFVF_10105, partial [Thiohalospira sp.]